MFVVSESAIYYGGTRENNECSSRYCWSRRKWTLKRVWVDSFYFVVDCKGKPINYWNSRDDI